MVKFCPTCGKPLQFENAEICPSCGVRIQSPTMVKPENRNPWIAVILSFFFVGWGQWYNGKTWDGLKFFGSGLIIYIIATFFTKILFLLYIVIWIYGMYDAYTTAEKINRGEESFSGKSVLFWLPVVLIVLIILVVSAAFVFGMTGNISKTKVVAVTLNRLSKSEVLATYYGGQDGSSLTGIVFNVGTNTGVSTMGSVTGTTPLPIGNTVRFNAISNSHIVAVGYFTDGSIQVLIDTNI